MFYPCLTDLQDPSFPEVCDASYSGVPFLAPAGSSVGVLVSSAFLTLCLWEAQFPSPLPTSNGVSFSLAQSFCGIFPLLRPPALSHAAPTPPLGRPDVDPPLRTPLFCMAEVSSPSHSCRTFVTHSKFQPRSSSFPYPGSSPNLALAVASAPGLPHSLHMITSHSRRGFCHHPIVISFLLSPLVRTCILSTTLLVVGFLRIETI